MASKMAITLYVNGTEHEIRVEPRKTLSDALRGDCGLTGTNVGCEHGVCGACTVLMDGAPVRSCLMFAVQAQGRKLRTVEGLAASPGNGGKLHALQQAFIDEQAAQCGYCVTGIVMSAKALLDVNPKPTRAEITAALRDNLCRCGTHARIIRAVERAAAAMAA